MTTTQRTIPVLIKTAKALQAKAEMCEEKAGQFYVSLGLTLAELKERKPKGTTWPVFVKKHFSYSRSRADELIQIGEGRTTIEKVRSDDAAKKRLQRANPPGRPGGSEPLSAKAQARSEKAEAAVEKENAAALAKHLQEHNRQVGDYTDAVKAYVIALKNAALCAERFSAPETVRFVSRKHDEIQKLQSEFEDVLNKQVAKAA